jgi:hypothetical protein
VQFDDAARATTERAEIEAEPCSYDAEAADIRRRHGAAIIEARRMSRAAHEIADIIRSLRQRQEAELRAARDRRRMHRRARPGPALG